MFFTAGYCQRQVSTAFLKAGEKDGKAVIGTVLLWLKKRFAGLGIGPLL
jgi:hypothetical protein